LYNFHFTMNKTLSHQNKPTGVIKNGFSENPFGWVCLRSLETGSNKILKPMSTPYKGKGLLFFISKVWRDLIEKCTASRRLRTAGCRLIE
jgi:hypothetical protein